MSGQRKTYPGRVFKGVFEVIRWISLGRWVCIDEKPCHPEFVMDLKLRGIASLINRGRLRQCLSVDRHGEPYNTYDDAQMQHLQSWIKL